MVTSNPAYRTAARNTYQLLKSEFAASNNFWRLGHTFDTIIDYFQKVDHSDVEKFVPVALERYTTTVNPRLKMACLYDDFGWWGIAALRGAMFFPRWTAEFWNAAGSCWTTIHGKGAAVWDSVDQTRWAKLKPRFDGGVWNCTFSEDAIDGNCATPCNPLSGKDAIRGFQNTVTNGLHFVLAARFSLRSSNTDYRTAAEKQYAFLEKWFHTTDVDPLLNVYGPGKAVVRERVSAYDASSDEPMLGYNPKLAWSGDQGLVLGGLVARMQYAPKAEYAGMLDYAKSIFAGVTDSLTKNQILQPWTPGEEPPSNDIDDYCTGIAVFMRYVLDAWQTNSDLQKLVSGTYRSFIAENADRIVSNPSSCSGDDAMANLTNDLAILVTAIGIGL